MRIFLRMMLIALVLLVTGCIPSFAGHGGGGMKEYAEISISVADMDASLPFYQRLGFDVIEEDRKPHRRVILSDNQIFLRLEETPFDSPRLVYISSEAADRAERLHRAGVPMVEHRSPDGGTAKEVKDPNGVTGVLRHGRHPADKIWKHDPQIGQFDELSIETSDIPRTLEFWQRLGFESVVTFEKDDPPVQLQDQALRIGLYQNKLSRAPVLTYLCKNLDSCTERLKKQGVQFDTEEKDERGRVSVATLKAPDSQIIRLKRGKASPNFDEQRPHRSCRI